MSAPRVSEQLTRGVAEPHPLPASQPIAHCTLTNQVNAESIALVVSAARTTTPNPPKSSDAQKVSFTLPSNHSDKYSEAYRQLTPARLQLACENTPWQQSPVAKNWLERSCFKVRAVTLPATYTTTNLLSWQMTTLTMTNNQQLQPPTQCWTMIPEKNWSIANSDGFPSTKPHGTHHTQMKLEDSVRGLANTQPT